MQGLYGSRLHFRNFAQTGSDDDRTTGSRWCKLDDSHSVTRLDVKVYVKPNLFNVEGLGAVNIRNRYRHQLKFHLRDCSHVLLVVCCHHDFSFQVSQVLGKLIQALAPALLHSIERCGRFGRRLDDDCLQREFRLAVVLSERNSIEYFKTGMALFVFKSAGGKDESLGLDNFVKDALAWVRDAIGSANVNVESTTGPHVYLADMV